MEFSGMFVKRIVSVHSSKTVSYLPPFPVLISWLLFFPWSPATLPPSPVSSFPQTFHHFSTMVRPRVFHCETAPPFRNYRHQPLLQLIRKPIYCQSRHVEWPADWIYSRACSMCGNPFLSFSLSLSLLYSTLLSCLLLPRRTHAEVIWVSCSSRFFFQFSFRLTVCVVRLLCRWRESTNPRFHRDVSLTSRARESLLYDFLLVSFPFPCFETNSWTFVEYTLTRRDTIALLPIVSNRKYVPRAIGRSRRESWPNVHPNLYFCRAFKRCIKCRRLP